MLRSPRLYAVQAISIFGFTPGVARLILNCELSADVRGGGRETPCREDARGSRLVCLAGSGCVDALPEADALEAGFNATADFAVAKGGAPGITA